MSSQGTAPGSRSDRASPGRSSRAARSARRSRAADARAQGAAARYEKAVIGALSDSEGAINRFLNARAALVEAEASLARERTAFALAEQRTARGEDDRLALMRARSSLTAAERRRDSAVAAKGQAAIALFKSLGGGWS
ncbi:TolC family protein [Sphingomonas sp. DT-204]|uniref:TolC family protein n=1 Tax=Sphingomonas sp. DT-204 TaxID=3396166 RepID=UPI003F196BCF